MFHLRWKQSQEQVSMDHPFGIDVTKEDIHPNLVYNPMKK